MTRFNRQLTLRERTHKEFLYDKRFQIFLRKMGHFLDAREFDAHGIALCAYFLGKTNLGDR